MAKPICNGADQSILRQGIRSIKRWASTDIKLTISPTVVSLRALFEMRSAFKERFFFYF